MRNNEEIIQIIKDSLNTKKISSSELARREYILISYIIKTP